jgi:hypothetical protein
MRATILVILEDTTDEQALAVKKIVDKAVEKFPKVETELSLRGK